MGLPASVARADAGSWTVTRYENTHRVCEQDWCFPLRTPASVTYTICTAEVATRLPATRICTAYLVAVDGVTVNEYLPPLRWVTVLPADVKPFVLKGWSIRLTTSAPVRPVTLPRTVAGSRPLDCRKITSA